MKSPFLTILVICFWACSPLGAIPLHLFLGGSPPPTVASFTAQTAVFDGTNDYARYSSSPGTVADGKNFTCSFWINFSGGDAVSQCIFSIAAVTASKLRILKNASNQIQVIGASSGATTQIDMNGGTAITAAGTGFDGSDGWYHVFICVDTTTQANCKIYINGVAESMTYTTITSASSIDLSPTSPKYTVGALGSDLSKMSAAIAEFVFYDAYHDLPTSFYSGTVPTDIGATGATPTGSAPDFYFSRNGSGDSWATGSSGNGYNLSVTGALTSTTAP